MKNDSNGVITYTPEYGNQLADNLLAGLLVLDGTTADTGAAFGILGGMSNPAIADYAASKTGNPNRKHDDLSKWEPWSNVEGGPKTLEVDGDFIDVVLNMSAETVTFDQASAGLVTAVQTLPPEVAAIPVPVVCSIYTSQREIEKSGSQPYVKGV
jgi:hypothetical protein